MYTYTVPETPLLPYLTNERLYEIVAQTLSKIEAIKNRPEGKLYKNVIDPFSALFDSMSNNMTLPQWLKVEETRQLQKSIQNLIGEFHQEVLGSIEGWENLGVGKVVDLKNKELGILAEIKNKFNTTKGNHKKEIYNDLQFLLDGEYKGYTGYYVEIIPSGRKSYDNPFTPPDNETKSRKLLREDIRVTDGKSFYEKVTGSPEALRHLYETLPIVITDILGEQHKPQEYIKEFMALYDRAY